MPLTEKVTFKTVVQKTNRIQIPKLVQWRFKLETSETFRVTVCFVDVGNREAFFVRMRKDGRIEIPRLAMALLKRDKASLEGYPIEVLLEPY